MSTNKHTNTKKRESKTWIIPMVIVVIAVIASVIVAIWLQHRDLSSAAMTPTAIEYRVHH